MNFLSLFSGIEAASRAWEPLGWTPVAFAEIEPAPSAVIKHHWPHVPNLGDVTAITDAQIEALGRIDVVIGGSPCQDLSVAGKRAGLTGTRSSLFHEQLRIFHASRHLCGARWLVWENVPGAFSSESGADFAVVVGALAGCIVVPPAKGWGNEGVALGANGLVEWCVLDAQWFGLAQRRKRVFAVLDTGDWQNRPPVLLEPESLRGDSPPRREARKDVAATIEASTGGCSGKEGRGLVAAPHVDVCPALKARDAKGVSSDGDGDGATLVPMVAHSLRADGFDASEDGTGRGIPLVAEACPTLTAGGSATGGNHQPGMSVDTVESLIAFSCKDHAADAGDISPTLRSMGHSASHANAGGQVAIAFTQNQRDEVRMMDVAGALAAESGAKQQTYAMQGMQVRRLTPRECERLQGFPDDHTLVTKGRKPMADGPRYKALGNSMAVPCIAWIGRQIERAAQWGAA